MRICVYGAGATGGNMAVRLAAAGHEVAAVARGAHLAAMRRDGLTLLAGDTTRTVPIHASDDPAELGPQDLVLVAVKATGLAGVAAGLAPLLGANTLVAFPQNGMSWWYPDGLAPDKPPPPELPIFRAGAGFRALLRPEQVLGGSIYSGNEVTAPGVIRNTSPGRNGVTLGAIVPGGEAAAVSVRALLAAAGIASPTVADIRRITWAKLLVNMSGSTIALATECRASICRTDAALGEIYVRLVREGMAIAAAHGYPLAETDPERQRSGLLEHKPSLLQDYEQRRPMEVAEIVLAPQAFARAQAVATPTLDALAAIVAARARARGLLPEGSG